MISSIDPSKRFMRVYCFAVAIINLSALAHSTATGVSLNANVYISHLNNLNITLICVHDVKYLYIDTFRLNATQIECTAPGIVSSTLTNIASLLNVI